MATQTATTTDMPLKIGLAGSFTVDPLVIHLKKGIEEQTEQQTDFFVAPYNQITQLSFNPDQLLGGATDILIVLWRLEDLGADNINITELDNFIDTIKRLRDNYTGTLIVATPPYPSNAAFDVHDLTQPLNGYMTYTQALLTFTQEMEKTDTINLLNLAGLMQDFGAAQAHDMRKWYLYKQPYNEKFWSTIAAQTQRIITAQKRAAKKCIVLDADNTLWGGIIGEDGLSGIEIGQDFPGSTFIAFQHYLLHLRTRGVFLAIASKNNPADVDEVFDKHDAMVLKRDHISSWQVHWNSKVQSLQEIADDLNIGLDALVFIDDNPKEIAEVQERLPDVTCLMVPEELADLPDLLRHSGLFDTPRLSTEDTKRADMMLAETKRKSERKQMSEEDFIKSLELKINITQAQEQHLGRITQLINKTNQFNLTTKRLNNDEVKSLSRDPDVILLGMDIADRFGEYGLVGVAILTKKNDTDWHIDNLMMSCRVLGRGAETSFLYACAQVVKKHGGKQLSGQYIPTPKNKMVENLYPDHNFITQKDGIDDTPHNWIIDISDIPPAPDYVDLSITSKEA